MKYSIPILAGLAALTAACQTVAEDSAQGPVSYKAHGTEPFWSLTLGDGKMKFSHAGVRDVRVGKYETRPSFNGWRYTSKRITADVTFAPCSDGMSDFTYKDTVTVMVDGQEYKGCGGGVVPPETLEGTTWLIMSIDDEAMPANTGAEVRFADGRMSGSVGCNRLGAEFSFKNRALSFGPVMSTKMACPDPVGKQEAVFVGVLGALASTLFPGDGNMVLTGKNGGKIELRQSM